MWKSDFIGQRFDNAELVGPDRNSTRGRTQWNVGCNWAQSHWIDRATINLFIAGIGASCGRGDNASIHACIHPRYPSSSRIDPPLSLT